MGDALSGLGVDLAPARKNVSTGSGGGGAVVAPKATTPSPQPQQSRPWWQSVLYGPTEAEKWKPSGNAFWDLITRPVAKEEGIAAAARDYGLSTADAATMGWAAKAMPKKMQDLVNQAHQNLGLMDYAAQGIGYAALPGAAAGKIAGRLGAEGLIRAVGEGTAAGAVNQMGHGDANLENAIYGGLEGAGAGALGYGVGKGVQAAAPYVGQGYNAVKGALGLGGGDVASAAASQAAPAATDTAASITAQYKANKEAEYAKLKDMTYDTQDMRTRVRAINKAIQDADEGGSLSASGPNGGPPDALKVATQLQNQSFVGNVSADSLNRTYKRLGSYLPLQPHEGAEDAANRDIAQIMRQHIEDAMQNGKLSSDHQPGDPWATKLAADKLNTQYERANTLDEMQRALGIGQGAPTPQSLAGGAIWHDPQFYGGEGGEAYQGFQDISNIGREPEGMTARQFAGVLKPAAAAAAGMIVPPFASLPVTLGMLHAGAEPLYKGMQAQGARRALNAGIAGAYRASGLPVPQTLEPPLDPGGLAQNALKNFILPQAGFPRTNQFLQNQMNNLVQYLPEPADQSVQYQ